MLTAADLRQVTAAFGVSESQVRRDHLISHVLRALAQLTDDLPRQRPVFFGGTALARTWLPEGRLSEDIDLYVGDRAGLISLLEGPRGLTWLLRREFPGCRWDPALSTVRSVEPGLLRAGSLPVRVQLLTAEQGYATWPTEERAIAGRYADVGEFRRLTPTLPAFVAMKLGARCDRRAPRDLWDLRMLAERDALTPRAASLVKTHSGLSVAPRMFERAPDPESWSAALDGQTAAAGSPAEALSIVRSAWIGSGVLPT